MIKTDTNSLPSFILYEIRIKLSQEKKGLLPSFGFKKNFYLIFNGSKVV